MPTHTLIQDLNAAPFDPWAPWLRLELFCRACTARLCDGVALTLRASEIAAKAKETGDPVGVCGCGGALGLKRAAVAEPLGEAC